VAAVQGSPPVQFGTDHRQQQPPWRVAFSIVERIPHPPRCERCGQSVGAWEPILAAPRFDESTSWLALSEKLEELPELIRHLVCPEDGED
jgi:hypothetical protein